MHIHRYMTNYDVILLLQALIRIHFELKKDQITIEMEVPCVHFVETSASLLQEMPSLIHRDYKVCQCVYISTYMYMPYYHFGLQPYCKKVMHVCTSYITRYTLIGE